MRKDRYKKPNKIKNEMDLEEFEALLMGNGGTGTSVGRRDMLQDTTVNACIDLISSTIAIMGLGVYQTYSDGSKGKINNDLNILLNGRVNENTNNFNFIRDLIKNMLIYGEGFAYIRTKGGRVKDIWNLDGGVTRAERLTGQEKILVNTNFLDKQMTLNYGEVIHIKDISDKFKAIAPIIEAKQNCRDMVNNMFLGNGTTEIKGIIKTEDTLSREAKVVLKQAFANVLKDSSVAGVGVLDNGLDFQQLTTTNTKSLQEQLVTELKEQLDNEIYAIFQVPKSLILGDGKESSYASLSVINTSFIKSLQKYIIQIEQECTAKLLTAKEKIENMYIKMNSRKSMRMTDEERASYYKQMVQSGIMSVNECRRLEDLPDDTSDISDEILLSLNYCPASYYMEYLSTKNNNLASKDESKPREDPKE